MPEIGPKLADKLLQTFGNVRKVFTATKDELLGVEGFREKRTEEISQFLDEPYLVGEKGETSKHNEAIISSWASNKLIQLKTTFFFFLNYVIVWFVNGFKNPLVWELRSQHRELLWI